MSYRNVFTSIDMEEDIDQALDNFVSELGIEDIDREVDQVSDDVSEEFVTALKGVFQLRRPIEKGIAFCHNCQWWTHDSAKMDQVIGEEGFSVCGKTHVIPLYGEERHVNLITHGDMEGCKEWIPDLPVPVMSDEEVQDLVTEHDLADAEEDDVTDEEWKVLVADA